MEKKDDNTTQHNTFITLLLFSIGILFSCNTFAVRPPPAPKPYAVHKIGQAYGGGIVYYVYDGGQHGLITALNDPDPELPWSNGFSNTPPSRRLTIAGAFRDGVGAGAENTTNIIAHEEALNGVNTAITEIDRNANYAAKACARYTDTAGVFGDWYLPSKYEFNLLLEAGLAPKPQVLNVWYWTSTEVQVETQETPPRLITLAGSAWLQNLETGEQSYTFGSVNKLFPAGVHCIRSF